MALFIPGQYPMDALAPVSDIGAALFIQNDTTGRFDMLANVLGLPATGGAPAMLDTTVTTSRQERQMPGRLAAATYEVTMHLTVGNVVKLKKIVNTNKKFIALYPNGVGFDFSGIISAWVGEASLGSVVTIETNIAVQSSNAFVEENVLDLIDPPCYFTSVIPAAPVPSIAIGDSFDLAMSTTPPTATVTAVSSAPSVATATVTAGTLKVTGVAAGTVTIVLTAKAAGYSDWLEAFNLVVTAD